MKLCNKCKVEKPASEFYKKATAKDGLFWWCRDCHKAHVKAGYYKLAASAEYKEKERLRVLAYNKENPERVAESNKKYREKNVAKLTARTRQYVLAREKRTPNWLSEDDFWLMEQAYELAVLRTKLFGFQWDVDHEIPLHGKLVSGLHVPHNLRVIPACANRSKSNKFVVT